MSFYENFSYVCNLKNIPLGTVCDACGLNSGIHTKWKTSSPKLETVEKVAEYLGVSIDYLTYGKESDSTLTEDEQKLINCYRKLSNREQQRLIGRAELLAEQVSDQTISIITHVRRMNIAKIAAGAGISTPFTSNNEFELKEFPTNTVPLDADCGIPINGDSMEPDYPHDSIVWVKRDVDIQDGDVVIAILNGSPYCKISKPDGLYSINEEYDPMIITENDDIKIFGKVIGCYIE